MQNIIRFDNVIVTSYIIHNVYFNFPAPCAQKQGRQTGGGLGALNPSEFWMGGFNTCQPPMILRKKFLGRVGSP